MKDEVVASAIEEVDYATLIAESIKVGKPDPKQPVIAAYAMGSITAKGEYDDLLGKA